jgi:hypothetical protein
MHQQTWHPLIQWLNEPSNPPHGSINVLQGIIHQGGVLLIAQTPQHTAIPNNNVTPAIAMQSWSAIPMAQSRLITQQPLNDVRIRETFSPPPVYTPQYLCKDMPPSPHINFEHYTNPTVHRITGKTILSYCKLMHDPAMAKIWQTAFGKDFWQMAQGDNKTWQRGQTQCL